MLLARPGGLWHPTLPFLPFLIHALPFNDTNQIKPPSSDAVPESRGSLTILFSCGAAFVICVWTSLHLNVMPIEQSQKESQALSRFLGRTVWALIGLFAPDLILAVALHQLLVAREYRNYVNKRLSITCPGPLDGIRRWLGKVTRRIVGKRDSEPRKSRERPMSLELAYFAAMGGFAIDIHNVCGTRRLTVKIPDLNQLFVIDRIHDFPICEIKDKKKATTFAKTIACAQIGWVFMQCLGRQYAGLHITLLEVSTSVHVVIAILTYAMWWEKPADISQPIVILQQGVPRSTVELYNFHFARRIQSVGRILEDGLRRRGLRSDSEFPGGTSNTQPKYQEGGQARAGRTLRRAQTFKETIGTSGIPDPNDQTAPTDPRPNIAMALLACQTAETVPEKAKELVGLFPKAVRNYLRKRARRDVITAVVQLYRRKTEIHKDILAATLSAAFSEANRTNFKIASTKIRDEALKLIESDAQGPEQGKNEGNSDTPLDEVLEKIQESVRKRTFRKAYEAAFRAATTASDNVKNSETDEHTGDSGPMVTLRATYQAASAATRMASREAVRLAALKEALGKIVSAEAVCKAFQSEFSNLVSTKDGDNLCNHTLEYVHREGEYIKKLIRESVSKKFYEQFHGNLRLGLGTNAKITTDYVELGIYMGIKDAITEFLDKAKASGTASGWEALFEEARVELASLDNLKSNRNEPRLERLRGSFQGGGAVLTDQFFAVPGLFGKEVPRLFRKVMPRLFDGILEASNDSGAPKDGSTALKKDLVASEGGGAGRVKNRHKGPKVPEFFGKHWQARHRAIILIFSTFMSAFYGGTHATKWDSHWFATGIEKILWQASCVVGTTVFIPGVHLLLLEWQGGRDHREPSRVTRITQFIILSSFILTTTLFLTARTYLVLESFISLRYLPPDAFESLAWSETIPHI